MILGTRRIRSAGRSSGSIEVTLPAQLQSLEGIECRLVVRDGPKPEIVLQPDLSVAQGLFRELWQRLRVGLADIDDIGDFAPANFTVALFTPAHWQERPPLACADALVMLRLRETGEVDERAQQALARLIAFLAVGASQHLGLRGPLALAFGDATAYLLTGLSVGLGADFERGLAHQIFKGAGSPAPAASPLAAQTWQQLRPGLRRVFEQFQHWQHDYTAYNAARERWYRALEVEQISRTRSFVEENLV